MNTRSKYYTMESVQKDLRFIQSMKNRSYHSGIKTTPYDALFGCKIKIGMKMLNLLNEGSHGKY